MEAMRLEEKITTNPDLTRKMVSYQDNRTRPGFRWFRYKEDFSVRLVERFLGAAGVLPHSAMCGLTKL